MNDSMRSVGHTVAVRSMDSVMLRVGWRVGDRVGWRVWHHVSSRLWESLDE